MTIADRVAREIARDDVRRVALGDLTNWKVTFKTQGVARAWSATVAAPAHATERAIIRHAAHGVWPNTTPVIRDGQWVVNHTTIATLEEM